MNDNTSRAAAILPRSSLPWAVAALVGALTGCGGGGESTDATSLVPSSSAPVTVATPPSAASAPANVTIASECIATAAPIALGSTGAQLDLSIPTVVELQNLTAPSVIVFENLTSGGSFTVTPYDLDPTSNCSTTGEASTLSAGSSGTLKIMALGTAGTRHFVDLRQVTPSIVQLCAQTGATVQICEPLLQTIYGSVVDESDQSIAGATVTVANAGAILSTMTDAQGNFILKTASNTLPSAFSATVSKPGFVPLALSFKKPDTTGGLISTDTQKLTAASADYAVIEVEPTVHHVGDSNFSGSANSAFQFPDAEGSSFTRPFSVQAEALAKATATITFVAKGVQCADQVLVNGALAFIAGLSPDDGSYAAYSVQVPVSLFVAGTNSLSIVAEPCSPPDLDDIEFQNVVVHFQ